MKIFTLILFLSLVFYFITKQKPEPSVININNALSTQNCIDPNGAINNQHYGCCNIKGRAYFMVEQGKKEN